MHNMWDGTTYLYNNVLEALGFSLGRARAYTATAAQLAADAAGTAYNTAANVAGTAVNVAGNVAGTAVNVASQAAGTAYNVAGQAAGTAANVAGNVAGTAYNVAGQAAGTAANVAGNVAGAAAGTASMAYDTAGERRRCMPNQGRWLNGRRVVHGGVSFRREKQLCAPGWTSPRSLGGIRPRASTCLAHVCIIS